MFKILKKNELSPGVFWYEVEAPRVAKKAQPGQFIVLRVDEKGERIPLTIADFDRERGIITLSYWRFHHATCPNSRRRQYT